MHSDTQFIVTHKRCLSVVVTVLLVFKLFCVAMTEPVNALLISVCVFYCCFSFPLSEDGSCYTAL